MTGLGTTLPSRRRPCHLLISLSDRLRGFPGGASGKESACRRRRCRFSPWVRKIRCGDLLGISSAPGWGGRHGNPLQVSCLENPHGQRILLVKCFPECCEMLQQMGKPEKRVTGTSSLQPAGQKHRSMGSLRLEAAPASGWRTHSTSPVGPSS